MAVNTYASLITSGSQAMFALKQALSTSNWKVSGSSDGDQYSTDGDRLTGAIDLENNSAWFTVVAPDDTRQWSFQRSSTNEKWTVKRSKAGMSGSVNATTPPVDDEAVTLINGSALFNTSIGNWLISTVTGSGVSSSFYAFNIPSGGGYVYTVLFDEPLSNLDAALRGQTRVELAKLHRELGATTVYVTHDQVEAMTLADRVVVMRNGLIEQQGPPLSLYDKPANRFVAQFIGTPPMNIEPCQALPQALQSACPVQARGGGLGFRPEDASIVQPSHADFVGKVELVEALGAETLVYVRTNDAQSLVVKQSQRGQWSVGQEVGVQLQASRTHWFDKEGQSIQA